MHIRIIHQYFKTPENGGGLRTYYLGRELVARGHTVSVITATNREKAAVYELEGMKIHALPVYYTNHLGFISRLGAFVRFVLYACRLLGKLPGSDLNYVITTPLTTGIIALYGKVFLSQSYYFEVGDLWPDAPIALGILKNPLLIRLSRWLEKTSYRNAAALIGLSPPISDQLSAKAPDVAVETITNFSPAEYLDTENSPKIRAKYNISPDDFVISYIGTLGLANHLEYFIDAVSVMSENLPAKCIIMGEGARRHQLQQYAKHKAVDILFLDHGNQQEVRGILGISQAMYISFAEVPVLWTGSPNKFFDSLAAGNVILMNFKGWIKDLVEENHLGFYCDPGRPEDLETYVRYLLSNPAELESIKTNCRDLAKKKYSPAVQVNILENLLHRYQA